MCTYAGIDTVETEIPRDLQDHWREPESYFIAPGAHCSAKPDAALTHKSARSFLATRSHCVARCIQALSCLSCLVSMW